MSEAGSIQLSNPRSKDYSVSKSSTYYTWHRCQVLLFLDCSTKSHSVPASCFSFRSGPAAHHSHWFHSADTCWPPAVFQDICWDLEIKDGLGSWTHIARHQVGEAENKSVSIRHIGKCLIWVVIKIYENINKWGVLGRPDIFFRPWRWLEGHQIDRRIDRESIQEKTQIEAQKDKYTFSEQRDQCGETEVQAVARNGREKQTKTKLWRVFQYSLSILLHIKT